MAACAALLVWTSLQEWKFPRIRGRQGDYYNLLVAGFNKGSLALDVRVPDALKNAKDPWDPNKRPNNVGMHDISYYNGHYYLYFGVVPAVALFWPFRALVGSDLPQVYAAIAFSLGGLLVAAWLWLKVVRDNFPGASLVTRAAGLAAIALAGGPLVVARRTSIWELPIDAGHYYLLWMFLFGYLGLRSRRPWVWLALSGASLGLAFGCRPTLAAGGAAMVVFVIAIGLQTASDGRRRADLRRMVIGAMAAGLPLAAIIAGLLAYNHARFGHYLEFGLNYQLNSTDERAARHFSISFLPYNFHLYFLSAPQWGRFFPFIHPIRFPSMARASGYYGYEYVYGAFIVCPILFWSAGAATLRRRPSMAPVAALAAAIAAVALASTALLLCFNTAAARYTEDFMPWWVWLGAIGWAAAEFRMPSGAAATCLKWAFGAAAAFSCALAFFESIELHGLFKYFNPSGYRETAVAFDGPSALLEKLAHTPTGPVEMQIAFPASPLGSYDPIVVTGVEYERDYVFVYYQRRGTVRLGYISSGSEIAMSPDIDVVPGRKYSLRVECGSLYPSEAALWYWGYNEAEARSLKGWVSITLDGKPVLTMRRPWHEATPGSVMIGSDTGHAFGAHFQGAISDIRRGKWSPYSRLFSDGGDIEIKFAVPDDGLAGTQPLLSVGKPGKADIVGLRMPDRDHASFTYEGWGVGLDESPPFALSGERTPQIRVRLGPALAVDDATPMALLRRSITIWVDGKPFWWRHTHYPIDPGAAIYPLSNDLGSSELVPDFGGRIMSMRDVPLDLGHWKYGPFTAVDMGLGGEGEGVEPLVATGDPNASDVLAVYWQAKGRAQLIYFHAGDARVLGPVVAWSGDAIHLLRAELPSLGALDSKARAGGGEGPLEVDVDGLPVWSLRAKFYPATSDRVGLGRNTVSAVDVGPELTCAVASIRQIRK